MQVDFYFDPSCPFCWVTSRWLLMCQNQRDIDINWILFSLAIKNQELVDKGDGRHLAAHRVERVMLAASMSGASLLDMYTNFGVKHFLAGESYSDELISSVLSQLKLDQHLLAAADDGSLDSQLAATTQAAVDTVGQDIGVPTIVFKGNGEPRGFFGPVIQALPDMDEAVKLWDGLVQLAANPIFYELKRGRTQGGPDVVSTAKC